MGLLQLLRRLPEWLLHEVPWHVLNRKAHLYTFVFLVTVILICEKSFGPNSKSNNFRSNHIVSDLQRYKYGDLSTPDARFVNWPLARVCRETTWVPGVVFQCDNNSGGIGNIRSFILTCLRYALEAGATGLIMPRIQTRSEKDLSELFQGYQPFDYFFDTQHFQASLNEACPQISIYAKASDVPHLKDERAEPLTPKTFGLRGGCDYRDLNRHTGLFGSRFREWLWQSSLEFYLPHVTMNSPRLFQPTWGVQWEWPVWNDGPEFANSFGGLLKIRPDILAIGRETVALMQNRRPGSVAQSALRGKFAGIHLRTENDALEFWPTFDLQFDRYMNQSIEKGILSVYLATGNTTEATRFIKRVGSTLEVTTKLSLLQMHPQLQLQFQSLTWDQKALVDFVVLLSCDYFMGVSPSSFSLTVAAKRHLQEDGIYSRPWKVDEKGDGRSILVGNYSNYWEDWIFMFDTLWP